ATPEFIRSLALSLNISISVFPPWLRASGRTPSERAGYVPWSLPRRGGVRRGVRPVKGDDRSSCGEDQQKRAVVRPLEGGAEAVDVARCEPARGVGDLRKSPERASGIQHGNAHVAATYAPEEGDGAVRAENRRGE